MNQWIATGLALAMTRVVGFVMTEGTVRAYFSLFTLHSFSPVARFVWPGSATGQDFPRSLALLAFLETDTEADVVVAGARGVVVALS